MPPQPYLKRVIEERITLSREQARELMQQLLAGAFADLELAALLGAVTARGENSEELAGFVDGMRAAAVPVPLEAQDRADLVDTCGTGGDLSGTFNISTAAALVAAAVTSGPDRRPVLVAKHGNRAVTSTCGSADVLEALGIPVALSPADAAAALRNNRFAFLHAPAMHPAMKAVMPVRRALGVRTFFNVLGPLTNPAGAQRQVMGVYSAHLVPIVAHAMRLLNVGHAFVVHGFLNETRTAGMDELSISGPSQFAEVVGERIFFAEVTPEMVGLKTAPIDELRSGTTAGENAEILRRIFAGEPGPRRDVVLLNSAGVLLAAGLFPPMDWVDAFRAAIQLAEQTIDSGAVTALIERLGRREP
ncbi:MAG TPA: anthranilate phosphoribosyltransferase [Acidobacteriaceae bacterium]